MEQLDLVFRGGSTGLMALFAVQLCLRQRNLWVAAFGTMLAVSILGYLWSPIVYDMLGDRWPAIPFYFAGHYVSFALWLFALTLFEDAFKPRWVHWAVAALFVLTFVCRYLIPADAPGLLFGERLQDDRFVLEHMMYLAVVVATMIRVGAGSAGDMVERRRRLRGVVIVGIGIYTLLVVVVELSMGMVPGGALLDMLNSGSIFALTFMILALILTLRPHGLMAESIPPRPASRTDHQTQEDQLYIAKLTTFFDQDKGHRREGLTIADLAESIGLPEYRARRLINQSLGFRNFNAFLNEYRVRDACQALCDPEQARTPVLTIALDVGYRSLGPFNRAFKELTGMTPTEYRRQKLESTPADS